MTYFLTNAETQLDGEAIALDTICLSQPQIEQALQLSQAVSSAQQGSDQQSSDQQWQIYLDALALAGFEQWLSDRANLTLTKGNQNCTVSVEAFKLYLLTTGSLSDTVVTLPEAAIDLPDVAAQLYVLVEVHEEQEQVLVKAVLRSDQLRQRQQLQGLTLNSDGTYTLPVSWFETSADDLLLYLRCLEPDALPIGGVGTTQPITTQATMSSPVGAINPQGELLRVADAVSSVAAAGAASVLQGAINTGLWVQNQLDAIAQELTWVLLPPPTSPALRYRGITGESAIEQFEQLVIELERADIVVPSHARGAYRELQWGKVNLRLYAVAWALPSPSESPEWSLLVILGSPSTDLPTGIKLQIRDADQLLVERIIAQDAPQTSLYGRVIGNWHEQFWVTVDMANGAIVTFPPFGFDPA